MWKIIIIATAATLFFNYTAWANKIDMPKAADPVMAISYSQICKGKNGVTQTGYLVSIKKQISWEYTVDSTSSDGCKGTVWAFNDTKKPINDGQFEIVGDKLAVTWKAHWSAFNGAVLKKNGTESWSNGLASVIDIKLKIK